MPLTPITFRPGIVRDATNYANKGGWWDGDKVRFRGGFPEQLGGWEKDSPLQFLGRCRSMHSWTSLAFDRYLGMGTHLKFYLYHGTFFYDVTPIRRTVTLGADPLETEVPGSGRILVEDVGHGAVLNDFVTISGASTVDGVDAGDINQELQIVEVLDDDHYVIATAGNATTGGVAGGGAAVQVAYQINVGLADFVAGTGWGAGVWGGMPWGTSSSVAATQNQLRIWSQSNFGEELIASPSGGGIYRWRPVDGVNTRMVNLASVAGAKDVPTATTLVAVSALDRHVIALGANPIGETERDLMLVRWSSQEDALDWTPTTENTAGFYRLNQGSQIVASLDTKSERLIWTDSALYTMRFTGPPYTYAFDLVAAGTSIQGANAAVAANNQVYWMGAGNFYTYSGRVEPISCPIRDYVFNDFNESQRAKVYAGRNARFNEVIWFYASAGSTDMDRYVLFNYVDQTWAYGQLNRTAWLDVEEDNKIYAASNGYVYAHESGTDADGEPMNSFIESADFDIAEGESFMFVRRIIPDIEFRGTAPILDQRVDVTLLYRGANGEDHIASPFVVYAGKEGQKHVRVRGRQMALRLDNNAQGTSWRFGTLRLDVRPDGRR